jgi:hypothetical protein
MSDLAATFDAHVQAEFQEQTESLLDQTRPKNELLKLK